MEGTILDHSRRGGADHGKRTRSDGVRHGKCRGGEQRAVFAVILAIFLSRGRKKTVLIVPAKVKRKVLLKRTRRSLFFVEPLAKSLGLYVL